MYGRFIKTPLKQIIAAALMLVLLTGLPSTFMGCAQSSDNESKRQAAENAAFVKRVLCVPGTEGKFANLFVDPALRDISTLLLCSGRQAELLTRTPTYLPIFALGDIQTEADESNPALVSYSCTIPGATGIAFNTVYGQYYWDNDTYSPRIRMAGEFTVVTDSQGVRKIDITDEHNPLSIYLRLRYMQPSDLPELNSNGSNQKVNDLSSMLTTVGQIYSYALQKPAFISDVLIPELSVYKAHFSSFTYHAVKAVAVIPSFGNLVAVMSAWVVPVCFSFLAALLLFFLFLYLRWRKKNMIEEEERIQKLTREKEMRFDRLSGDVERNLHQLKQISTVLNERVEACTALIRNRLIKPDTVEKTIAALEEAYTEKTSVQKELDRCCQVVIGSRNYDWSQISDGEARYQKLALEASALQNLTVRTDDPQDLLKLILQTKAPQTLLLDDIQLVRLLDSGLQADATAGAVTLAGWAAIAIGLRITAQGIPDIEENRAQLQSALDEYNQEMAQVRKIAAEISKLLEQKKAFRTRSGLESTTQSGYTTSAVKEQEKHNRELLDQYYQAYTNAISNIEQSVAVRVLKKGYSLFAYLINLMTDPAHDCNRFIKQGVIVGLVPYLTTHREDAHAQQIMDMLVQVRKQMICDDHEMSFFEVRVPAVCTPSLYAIVLHDVLYAANPSIAYCDTAKLLDTLIAEVPEAMRLLSTYPLRLIDPANDSMLGFYHFKPYRHAQWVQYQPPMNEGKVIRRYHEIQDKTLPLSAGINIRLFTDSYAVVPTIFHEYTHFIGDMNEASVFLKTQLFSIRFYRKYEEAEPARDNVFTRLILLLGKTPSPLHVNDLNALIEQYYGRQVSTLEAKQVAERTIVQINLGIMLYNQHNQWCPDVPMPLLLTEQAEEGEAPIRDGDLRSGLLLYEIIRRYAQAPRTLTPETFADIVNQMEKTGSAS